jgi:predicted phage terminase large subunit-like protein
MVPSGGRGPVDREADYVVRITHYTPHEPTPTQSAFLLLPHREAFYGGAGGGGKSDALLMGALQYADVPGYHALILRNSYAQLSLPEALMDRALEWLVDTDAKWNGDKKTWTFPSGATLTFGYLERPNDKYRYKSSAFHYIAFDELTEFRESDYVFLFSRLRRLRTHSFVPSRVRSASNPGGIGHDWVKARFVDPETASVDKPFIAARLSDNPYLDQEDYAESLSHLDPTNRDRILHGDWSVREPGQMFSREWFRVAKVGPSDPRRPRVRAWDFAATEPRDKQSAAGPSWTVGVLMSFVDGRFIIEDVRRARISSRDRDALVVQTAALDGYGTWVRFEQEPGSAGKDTSRRMTGLLAGYIAKGIRSTGPKTERAAGFASQAEAGNVIILGKPWTHDYLEELEVFPDGSHDDQVDATSLAFRELSKRVTTDADFDLGKYTRSDRPSHWRD